MKQSVKNKIPVLQREAHQIARDSWRKFQRGSVAFFPGKMIWVSDFKAYLEVLEEKISNDFWHSVCKVFQNKKIIRIYFLFDLFE